MENISADALESCKEVEDTKPQHPPPAEVREAWVENPDHVAHTVQPNSSPGMSSKDPKADNSGFMPPVGSRADNPNPHSGGINGESKYCCSTEVVVGSDCKVLPCTSEVTYSGTVAASSSDGIPNAEHKNRATHEVLQSRSSNIEQRIFLVDSDSSSSSEDEEWHEGAGNFLLKVEQCVSLKGQRTKLSTEAGFQVNPSNEPVAVTSKYTEGQTENKFCSENIRPDTPVDRPDIESVTSDHAQVFHPPPHASCQPWSPALFTSAPSNTPPSEKESGVAQLSSSYTLHALGLSVDVEGCVQQLIYPRLPPELFVKILAYLTPQQLCRCISPVCKTWYTYAADPVLWRRLDLSQQASLHSDVLFQLLRRAPLLRHLSLHAREYFMMYELDFIAKHCGSLLSLDLGFSDVINTLALRVLVQACRELRILNLEGCSKIDAACIEELSHMPHLCQVNLSHCDRLDSDALEVLIQRLKHGIRGLNIDGIFDVNDGCVVSLCGLHQDSLTCLELDGAELSDVALLAVAQCCQLVKLAVSFCERLTDESLLRIMELQHLESLKLKKGTEFTTTALLKVFTSGHLKRLYHLDLSECPAVDDDVLVAIVRCCGAKLQDLALCWCWDITDTGLAALVHHCSSMMKLDLTGVDKITGDPCLKLIPEAMPLLTYFDLRQCNKINDDLISGVVREKPDLKALNYFGGEFEATSADS